MLQKFARTSLFLVLPAVLFAQLPNPYGLPIGVENAKKVAAARWQSEAGSTPLTLLPFTSITNECYSTYLKLS